MKNIMLSGIIGAVVAVVLNYAILFMTICFGWKNKNEALCLPELEQLLHSGTLATLVQTLVFAALGFIICALITTMKGRI